MPDETTPANATVTESAPASAPASTDLSGFAELGLAPDVGLKPAPAPAPAPAQKPIPAPKPHGPEAASRKDRLATLKDPAARNLLLNTSNEAFEYFYDLALKLQNGEYLPKTEHERLLKEQADAAASRVNEARYYDHERGYMLTPEYDKVATDYDSTAQRLAFWEEQAGAFAAGQPFRVLQQNKDGQWVPSAQQYSPKDNPTAIAGIQSHISRAHAEMMKLQERLEAMPKAHKEAYSKHRASIDSLNTELFGRATNEAFKTRASEYLGAFPESLRGDNQIQLIANLRAAGDLLIQEVERLRTELGKSNNKAKSLTQGAPAPVTAGTGREAAMDDKAAVAAIDAMFAGR